MRYLCSLIFLCGFLSLMDCYSAEFEPLAVEDQGAPLEHLVACISGIELVYSGYNKHLQSCPHKPALDNKSDGNYIDIKSYTKLVIM